MVEELSDHCRNLLRTHGQEDCFVECVRDTDTGHAWIKVMKVPADWQVSKASIDFSSSTDRL